MVERRKRSCARTATSRARECGNRRTCARSTARVVLGGLAPLARHLKVAPERLRPWLEGREDDAVFLAARC